MEPEVEVAAGLTVSIAIEGRQLGRHQGGRVADIVRIGQGQHRRSFHDRTNEVRRRRCSINAPDHGQRVAGDMRDSQSLGADLNRKVGACQIAIDTGERTGIHDLHGGLTDGRDRLRKRRQHGGVRGGERQTQVIRPVRRAAVTGVRDGRVVAGVPSAADSEVVRSWLEKRAEECVVAVVVVVLRNDFAVAATQSDHRAADQSRGRCRGVSRGDRRCHQHRGGGVCIDRIHHILRSGTCSVRIHGDRDVVCQDRGGRLHAHTQVGFIDDHSHVVAGHSGDIGDDANRDRAARTKIGRGARERITEQCQRTIEQTGNRPALSDDFRRQRPGLRDIKPVHVDVGRERRIDVPQMYRIVFAKDCFTIGTTTAAATVHKRMQVARMAQAHRVTNLVQRDPHVAAAVGFIAANGRRVHDDQRAGADSAHGSHGQCGISTADVANHDLEPAVGSLDELNTARAAEQFKDFASTSFLTFRDLVDQRRAKQASVVPGEVVGLNRDSAGRPRRSQVSNAM